jgi:uncharacterized protein YxjI
VAITLVCECGRRLDFKDEYAGRQVRCPDCDIVNTVGTAAPPTHQASGDGTFAREKFLLKQKALAIREKYDVVDESGAPILFVERPRHLFRGLVALFAGILAGFGVFTILSLMLPERGTISPGAEAAFALGTFALAFLTTLVVAIALSPKRHVTFYRDKTGRERVLEILQDSKWQPITATFTVKDEDGKTIALLRKNYLYNIFRRRWVCLTPGGNTLMMAKEDSILLSLLRRLLGTFFGLLRAQFIFTRGTSDVVIGEFNRKFTLLDRYVLDMTRDARRQVDRRLALAMGVMLDSGERR